MFRRPLAIHFVPGLLILALNLPVEVNAKSLNRRSIAVIKLHQDDAGNKLRETKETAAAAAGVARALGYSKQHPDYLVKNLHEVLNTGGEQDRLTDIQNGKSYYEAGLKAMEAGETDDAVLQLSDAAILLERSFVFLRKPKTFKTLLLHLGSAQLANGLKKDASKSFERAVLMGARAKWVPLEGRALKLFNAAKTSVYRKPGGTIEVITEPPNVEVYVDGTFRGVSPMNVPNVLEGKHIVTLKKLGFKRLTKTVDVQGGEENTEVFEDLEYARRHILLKQLFDKLPQSVAMAEKSDDKVGGEAIGLVKRMLQCELAVILRVRSIDGGQEVQAMVFDTMSRKLLNTRTELIQLQANLRNRTAFRAFTKELMSFDYALALGAASDPGPAVVEDGGIVSKWWFWTAVGAVVVGATAGGLYYVMNQEDPPPFEKDGSGALVIAF